METGGRTAPTVLEVLGNIDAMQLAIEDAAAADRLRVEHLSDIHSRLMARAPNSHLAGVIRTDQKWIGGNDYNPCGADFVPPPPEYVGSLLSDLCETAMDDSLPPLVQAAVLYAHLKRFNRSTTGTAARGEP